MRKEKIRNEMTSADRVFSERDYKALSDVRPAFPAASLKPVVFNSEQSVQLPTDYKLTKYDVVNGRGRKSYNHVGNRRFRQMVSLNLKRYYEAQVKADKSTVVAGLVNAMREACPSGGFLKLDPKRKDEKVWITVGGRETREKVGHCLRDMIASMRDDPRRKSQFEILQAGATCDQPLENTNPFPTKMSKQQKAILRELERGNNQGLELLLRATAEG